MGSCTVRNWRSGGESWMREIAGRCGSDLPLLSAGKVSLGRLLPVVEPPLECRADLPYF